MLWLKQSTAVTIKLGPFLDEDDGKTAETSLTISQANVRLSKNGGDLAQKHEATSCTHDELGVYDCPLDAIDTATLGRLQLFVHESGALPVWHEFMVVPANEYDSLVSGSDVLDVNVAEIAASVVNEIADQILEESIPDHQNIGYSLAGYTAAIIADTGELQTDLTNDGRLDVLIDAIKAVTDNLPNSGALTDLATAAALAVVDEIVDAILADTGTAGVVLADGAITAAKIAPDAITSSELATSAVTEIANAVQLAGAGAITWPITITQSGSPVPDCDVWVTTDEAGAEKVASGETSTAGKVTFYLDAGDYYVWCQKPGYNFTMPTKITVTE
jgi:hypothetical protein